MTATKGTMTTDRDVGHGAAGRPLGPHERGVVVGTLLLIAMLVAFDVGTDLRQGASGWHVALEIAAGLAALAGASYLLRDSLRMRRRLASQARDFTAFRVQAAAWQAQARRHVVPGAVADDGDALEIAAMLQFEAEVRPCAPSRPAARPARSRTPRRPP